MTENERDLTVQIEHAEAEVEAARKYLRVCRQELTRLRLRRKARAAAHSTATTPRS